MTDALATDDWCLPSSDDHSAAL